MDARWRRRAGNAFLLVLFLLLFGRTIRRAEPVNNWDTVGYMALALEWEEDDPARVHQRTYAAARAELPPEVFQSLIAPGVRRARYDDWEAFTEHQGFHRGRVLYSLAVYLVYAAGAPLTAAPWWVSLGSFAATALLILVWASRHLSFPLAALLAACLAHAPPLLTTAGYASADALATFVTCAGIFALLERRSLLGASLFGAAILVRPDSVIVVGCVVTALFLMERGPERPSKRFLGAWLAISLAAYLAVAALTDAFPWWVVFHISFIEKALHPEELPTSIDLGVYGAVIGRQLAEIPGSGYFTNPRVVTGSTFLFLFAALAGLGLALWRRLPRPGPTDRHAAVLVALLAASALRWPLFPQLWDRFYAVLYVTVPLVLLALVVAALGRDTTNAGRGTAS